MRDMMDPPFDREHYVVHDRERLDRSLFRPHLAGIGISGTIGAGMFIGSGSIIGITGSVGTPLAYLFAGFVAASVMYTLSEMVAARPITGALIDFPHHFVDPSLGFAVCLSYVLSNICSMATLTEQSSSLAANFYNDPTEWTRSKKAGLNVGLIALTTLSHCLGVRFYGEFERAIMWFKLVLVVFVCFLMIPVSVGSYGNGPPSYNHTYNHNLSHYGFPPGWKLQGFSTTHGTNLSASASDANNLGISGPGGRLLALLNAVTLAMFACMGGEQVVMTAGEAKHPWKDLPAVMSFVYLIPLALYPLATLAVGANVNFAHPDLAHPYVKSANATPLSPFMIAVKGASHNGLFKALNAFFLISAYTAGNTALYLASRAAFILAQNYMLWFSPYIGTTNRGNTPINAILVCAFLGFLSLFGLYDKNTQPRIIITSIFTSTTACIYMAECISFLRFKAGLEWLSEKHQVFSRDDDRYARYLFRSRWQPLVAFIGIIGCGVVIIFSAVPALFILGAKLTKRGTLKDDDDLIGDVVGAWIGPALFVIFFLAYKGYPGSDWVRINGLTLDMYVMPSIEIMELNDRDGPDPHEGVAAEEARIARAERGVSDDEDEEEAARHARRAQQAYINRTLQARGVVWTGIWRELWSFVVVDDSKPEPDGRHEESVENGIGEGGPGPVDLPGPGRRGSPAGGLPGAQPAPARAPPSSQRHHDFHPHIPLQTLSPNQELPSGSYPPTENYQDPGYSPSHNPNNMQFAHYPPIPPNSSSILPTQLSQNTLSAQLAHVGPHSPSHDLSQSRESMQFNPLMQNLQPAYSTQWPPNPQFNGAPRRRSFG